MRMSRFASWTLLGLVLVLAAAVGAWAQAAGAQAPPVDEREWVVLYGNVYPQATSEFDVGPVDPSAPMKNLVLALKMSPQKQAELDQLLAEQQDPASPNYHAWLTPEAFGERFGATSEELATITGWLQSKGFVIEQVAKGRLWVNFSGTAADVENAFHTRMRTYVIDGTTRHANAVDPSIPKALAGRVAGIVSLHDFPLKALHTPPKPVTRAEYTYGSTHYLAPGDFGIIYDVNPAYGSGINGSGQTIAITARTHPNNGVTDWNNFRSQFGLPYNPPNIIINGADPGDVPDDDGETDLDVEWSGAVAPNATIDVVMSASSYTDGIALSGQYIVSNNLAPVMSTSYGLCEGLLGSTGNTFYNNLWAQAASQGISSFVSTGDNGVAGCDSPSASFGSGLAVNGLGSTPYNVAVGGTELFDWTNPNAYWQTYNSSTGVSAISYIPEMAWNESGVASPCPPGDTCGELWAGSGGVSSLYAKPSWQSAPGVPADGMRDLPDVALTAAVYDGYLVEQNGTLWVFGGTSAASPSFAGLMALVVQKTGARQGNPNTRLYQLGAAQYGGAGAAVFHDTTLGSNSVPGIPGSYFCTTAYDLATGLGSVDASALVNNWGGSGTCPTITLSPGSLTQGSIGTPYSQNITASGGTAPYTYAVTSGSLPSGTSLSSSGLLAGTPTVGGNFTFTVTATDAHSCHGQAAYNLSIQVPPPVITAGSWASNPFRFTFAGSNLQPGIQVYINNQFWPNVVWKSPNKIQVKGGKALKAAVPKGVPTPFTFVNPDGGSLTLTITW